jgi:hypothetical protein
MANTLRNSEINIASNKTQELHKHLPVQIIYHYESVQ